MPAKTVHRFKSRRRQSGAALMVFAALLVTLSAGLLIDRLSNRVQINNQRDQVTSDALAQAKAALISWSVSHPQTPGRLPYPDRDSDPAKYDGISDCITSPGILAPSHLLGRLPWDGEFSPDSGCFGLLDARLGIEAKGAGGEPLWYAVSANLVVNSGTAINPGLLDTATPTYPWLRVLDQNGNVVSDRVAAVIIAPGEAIAGQDRSLTSSVHYLDSVTIGGNTYGNADTPASFNLANPTDFIMYPDSRTTPANDDNFNDRLVYITIDELMRPVEKRVLGDAAVALQGYRASYGRYPWMSPFRDPGSATGAQTVTGRIDLVSGVSGDKITDNDADFSTASVAPGDLFINMTRRRAYLVVNVEASNRLKLKEYPGQPLIAPGDLQAGHAYNLRPAFNGIWGGLAGIPGDGREGHIPFIDVSVAESNDVATGFTITWSNGTVTSTCTPIIDPIYSLLPGECTVVTANMNAAASGSHTEPSPPVPATGAADNGECIWTTIDDLDCKPDSWTDTGAYTVDLCVLGNCVGGLVPNVPVDRTYTFPMKFTGDGQPTNVGNVKTRRVTNISQVTINIQDTVLGLPLGNGTVVVNPPDYAVDGIYFEIEDGNEFPEYFFTNRWHHYVYAKIAADHVAVNTITGNPSGDNCNAGTDCIGMQIGGATVRDEIQAVLVGAGGELGTQNRANGGLSDYFENGNAVQANDVAERAVPTSSFNDQVRVIRPNPP